MHETLQVSTSTLREFDGLTMTMSHLSGDEKHPWSVSDIYLIETSIYFDWTIHDDLLSIFSSYHHWHCQLNRQKSHQQFILNIVNNISLVARLNPELTYDIPTSSDIVLTVKLEGLVTLDFLISLAKSTKIYLHFFAEDVPMLLLMQ